MRHALPLVALLAIASCDERGRPVPVRPAAAPGPRVTMAALHATGGVPQGWRFTPPPGDPQAGRQAFMDYGCFACHAIAGESFAGQKNTGDRVGPELTGMGAHHPPEYFAEAIVNPDAVLVDGPGYIGPDGRSVMPAYPDLTLGQLADLVAYLQSLGGPHLHAPSGPTGAAGPGDAESPVPNPPAATETAFLVMHYAIREGQLGAFEQWFRTTGSPALLAVPGLLRIDTSVDRLRTPPVTTVFAFDDSTNLHRFMADPGLARAGVEFDWFVGKHGHEMWHDTPPVYRATTLSAARP